MRAANRVRVAALVAAVVAFVFWRFAIDALLSASLTLAAISAVAVSVAAGRRRQRAVLVAVAVVVASLVVLFILAALGGN